jgi:type I restriction enzyme, S subunit
MGSSDGLAARPPGWSREVLGGLLTRPPSYGINAAAAPYSPDLPTYIRITDIDLEGRFEPDPKVSVHHPLASSYRLAEGDLVFARTGATVGKSYRYSPADGELVFAGFLIRVTPDPAKLDPGFLGYYVQSKRYWDWVRTVSVRSGQPGINGLEYAQLPVDLPPIEEQWAIAATLTQVDQLIASLERLIVKKRDIKQGATQQLLSGKTRLPGFLDDWSTVHLGDHVKYLRTASYPRMALSTDGAGLGYLHYGDIHTSIEARLDFKSRRMPVLNFEQPTTAERLRVGDVVFVDASEDLKGVGKAVEIVDVPESGAIAGLHTIAARFDERVLANGFKAYLQFHPGFQSSLQRLAAGTKVLATTRDHISSVDLQLPQPEEQQAIAGILSAMDAEIEALEARLAKTRDVKQGMMQTLLTGQTRLVPEAVPA